MKHATAIVAIEDLIKPIGRLVYKGYIRIVIYECKTI